LIQKIDCQLMPSTTALDPEDRLPVDALDDGAADEGPERDAQA